MQPNNNQAPTTDYNQAFASYGSVYDPQVQQARDAEAQAYSTRDTTINQLKENQATTLSRLDQAKANAFSNNSLTSNARGLFYSGYAPATNQAYVTNTYNPNVEQANTTFKRGSDAASIQAGNTVKSLEQKIAQINQERANAANSLVMDTKQSQLQASQRAAKAAAKASTPSQAQISAAISSNLAKVTGRDGYVAPEDYAQAYIDWINSGGSASSFNSNFGRYKNPQNGYYNYAITNALKRG